MKYSNVKFLVFGMKKSGTACAEFLLSKNAVVGIFDEDEEVLSSKPCCDLVEKGAIIARNIEENEENYDERKNSLSNFDVVVLSPGVPIDNPIVVKLKKKKKRIIGEIELGYMNAKAPIIAVTGTNGKTTVSTLIGKTLSESGESSYLLGNVGTPFIKYADETLQTDVCVLEVSSFQLETVHLFTPHIGVMLNITEDHLDRHYNMRNYVYLKKRLFKNQRESEWAVLNYDDETVRGFAEGLLSEVVWFSAKTAVKGAYLKDGVIYYFDEEILPADKLAIKGEHNIENALAALCALKIYGVKTEDIVNSFTDFKGLKYRMENVGVYNGVTYINDSKATNVDSTLKAIKSINQNAVLIMGGKSKNQDFTPVFEVIKNSNKKIKHVILTGESRFDMLKTAQKLGVTVSVVADLITAVRLAGSTAAPGEAVLFSPATSSHDAFKDYIDRGERFNYLVRGLNEKTRG